MTPHTLPAFCGNTVAIVSADPVSLCCCIGCVWVCLQVIKCELFDDSVDKAVKRYPLMLLTAPTQAAAGYR